MEQLAQIDGGRIGVLFQHHLRRIVGDLEDRPANRTPRKMEIVLEFTPDSAADDGLLDGAKMDVQIRTKVPVHRSKVLDFGVRDGELRFNETSPDDHRVRDLPGMDEPQTEETNEP